MSSSRKTVLITGCSAGGIGAGMAEAFHQAGYHVFATVRNPAKAPQNLTKAPSVTILTLDVLQADSIEAAVDSVAKETGGRLDVLINNSGQNFIMPGLDTDLEDARRLFNINFFAPLAVLKAFAPLLVQASGTVVHQSSAAGHLPMPFMSEFSNAFAYYSSQGPVADASRSLLLPKQACITAPSPHSLWQATFGAVSWSPLEYDLLPSSPLV
jgi:1-acylglycerone phosphate reductase